MATFAFQVSKQHEHWMFTQMTIASIWNQQRALEAPCCLCSGCKIQADKSGSCILVSSPVDWSQSAATSWRWLTSLKWSFSVQEFFWHCGFYWWDTILRWETAGQTERQCGGRLPSKGQLVNRLEVDASGLQPRYGRPAQLGALLYQAAWAKPLITSTALMFPLLLMLCFSWWKLSKYKIVKFQLNLKWDLLKASCLCAKPYNEFKTSTVSILLLLVHL